MSVVLPEPTVGARSGSCRAQCLISFLFSFQNKEYASIEIVKTEMKGYGLRAEEDLSKCVFCLFFAEQVLSKDDRDTFIYEYIGDVVNNQSFKKRMRDYASEGIEHFYFMMLQKDEVSVAANLFSTPRFTSFVVH